MGARDPVGRILLENADGDPLATAEYGVPEGLREASLLTPFGAFLQNRHVRGQWIYRFDAPLGSRVADAPLEEFRLPTDPAWDGPVPTVPRPGWSDVCGLFERILAREQPDRTQVVELYLLTAQAWPEDRRG